MSQSTAIPASVQQAREEYYYLASRGRLDLPSDFISHAAWLIGSSTWRLKSGWAKRCAVCNELQTEGRRDRCEKHLGYEFVWRHHSHTAEEGLAYLMTQLSQIARMSEPDNGN